MDVWNEDDQRSYPPGAACRWYARVIAITLKAPHKRYISDASLGRKSCSVPLFELWSEQRMKRKTILFSELTLSCSAICSQSNQLMIGWSQIWAPKRRSFHVANSHNRIHKRTLLMEERTILTGSADLQASYQILGSSFDFAFQAHSPKDKFVMRIGNGFFQNFNLNQQSCLEGELPPERSFCFRLAQGRAQLCCLIENCAFNLLGTWMPFGGGQQLLEGIDCRRFPNRLRTLCGRSAGVNSTWSSSCGEPCAHTFSILKRQLQTEIEVNVETFQNALSIN